MQDANGCSRCLSILIRAVSAELVRRLWPVFLQIVRQIRWFRGGEITPQATDEFERKLQDLLREVGRIIVEWTFNNLEPDDDSLMPPQICWQGEYYTRCKTRSPLRRLDCLFGPIRLLRYCYRPLETAERCVFPLQLALGIVDVATPALADQVARLSADLTQQQLLGHLSRQGITWGVGTLRKLQQSMAENLEPFRQQAQADTLLAWLSEASGQSGPRKPSLSVGRDGIMLPVLKNKKYREGGTATVSVLDRYGRRLGTVYLGQMPEYGQEQLSTQLTSLLEEMFRRWSGPLPRLVYVTDAGHHPQEYFDQVLSQMTHPVTGRLLEWEWVLDYFHACEYITKLAEVLFGKGREATAWAKKMRAVLKSKPGGVFRVLRSAGALQGRRGLHGHEDDYWSAYSYLRKYAPHMDYVRCRHLNLPIGSGVTEAGCKILFTQRFKQSGMKWSIAGGASILVLRTLSLSGIWTEVRSAFLASYTPPYTASPRRSDAQPMVLSENSPQ
jgi:hypothetical protein